MPNQATWKGQPARDLDGRKTGGMMKMPGHRLSRVLICAVLIVLLLTSCGGAKRQEQPKVLRILASSELIDLEPLLPEMEKAVKVPIRMDYAGSIEVVDRLVKGVDTDLAWPAQSAALGVYSEVKSQVLAQEKIMLSPVVVGVKTSLAERWGWVNNPSLTWRDIAERAAVGELRYMMSSPANSQSALSALMGLSASLLGRSDPLKGSDLPQVEGKLVAFLNGQALTVDAGKLSSRFLERQATMDGIIAHESTILALNRSDRLQEKLVLVYPSEGITTSDYPLMLVNANMRSEYNRLVSLLRSPSFQKKLMDQTLRRPANPAVPAGEIFPKFTLIELPYPNQVAVLEQLRAVKAGTQSVEIPPAAVDLTSQERHLIFVLDVSASMRGRRLDELKQAVNSVIEDLGEGQVRVTVIAYNHVIAAQATYDLDLQKSETWQGLQGFIASLQASGGTASYSAMQTAYETVRRVRTMSQDLPTRVIVVTDGNSTQGMTGQQFEDFISSASDLSDIAAYIVVTCEGEVEKYEKAALATGGFAINAEETSLADVLLEMAK